MSQETTLPTAEEVINSSSATDSFKKTVIQFQHQQAPTAQIRFRSSNPPIKVLRVILGLLERFPELEVSDVDVDGVSGCSDYRGKISINSGEKTFDFVWDCAWKASEMGWKDYFGDPDQIRAARTFGFRCFKEFEEIA